MDKKVTQSLTLIGGAGAVAIQSLMGFGVLPTEATAPANEIVTGLVELIRNVFVMISIFGARRAMSR